MNWSNACKGIGKASTPFEYAAKLTEVMLLGVVALRAGEKIHYDGANMKVTNSKKANDLLKREYRRAGRCSRRDGTLQYPPIPSVLA